MGCSSVAQGAAAPEGPTRGAPKGQPSGANIRNMKDFNKLNDNLLKTRSPHFESTGPLNDAERPTLGPRREDRFAERFAGSDKQLSVSLRGRGAQMGGERHLNCSEILPFGETRSVAAPAKVAQRAAKRLLVSG